MPLRYRLLLALPFALGSCKGTEPFVPTPTSITLSATSVTFNAIGGSRLVHATVLDQKGDSIPGAQVTWQSLAPTIASVIESASVMTEPCARSSRFNFAGPKNAIERLSGDQKG